MIIFIVSLSEHEINYNCFGINGNINLIEFTFYLFQDQDGRPPGSRPSSAPAEPNAKAARKASKKMEKEAR